MRKNQAAKPIALLVLALVSSGCVSGQQHDAVMAEKQELKAQLAHQKAQLAHQQAEQKYVAAGDLLFPEGGYQLSPIGKAELANNIVPKLKGLRNARIVVYGYTDNNPVGPALQSQGIPDNLVLSTRRTASVVSFLVSQGVNPDIISAKGLGDTHPVSSNDTPQSRAQNRRIEITIVGTEGNDIVAHPDYRPPPPPPPPA
jgi:chemotaxis protein MotB